ncbi:MAG: hypothetical protein ACLTSX_14100 [Collinsella sp.]
MSNGVIPVVSNCVEDFADASCGSEHVICCSDADMVAAVVSAGSDLAIDVQAILTEYQSFFDGYFDLEKKRSAMREFLAPVACDMEH